MLFLESLVERKKVHLTVSFDEYKNRQVCSFIIDEIDRKEIGIRKSSSTEFTFDEWTRNVLGWYIRMKSIV